MTTPVELTMRGRFLLIFDTLKIIEQTRRPTGAVKIIKLIIAIIVYTHEKK